MNPPSLNIIVQEVEKIERRWRWQKWAQFVIGSGLLLYGFYVIVKPEALHGYVAEIPPFLLSAFGAAMLGTVFKNWSGSKELKLLGKFKTHYKDEAGST